MTSPALEQARSKLVAKIREQQKQRREQATVKKVCPHGLKTYRETIVPDEHFHGEAYYRVKACEVCKIKMRLELVVRKEAV